MFCAQVQVLQVPFAVDPATRRYYNCIRLYIVFAFCTAREYTPSRVVCVDLLQHVNA